MNALETKHEPPHTDSHYDVLVVEDDTTVRLALQRILTEDGYRTLSASTISQATALILAHRPGIALLDLALPDGDGVDFIKAMKLQGVQEIIIVSGTDDSEKTHRCLDAGVFDFIVKPASRSDVLRSIHRADASRRQTAIGRPEYPPQLTPGFGALEGTSAMGTELIRTIKRLATQSPLNALIIGQPGVLKSDNAALLHHYSGRSGPALVINCASESDDFSLERLVGRRAGASAAHVESDVNGYLSKADHGALVLDDLASLPLPFQRVLEKFIRSGEALAVNALTPTPYDCSIIGILRESASQALARGALHEPLYYALANNTLLVPPLVERRDDIELFARSAVDQLNELFNTEKGLSAELIKQLTSYYWPGNLMQLKNSLFSAYRATEPGENILGINGLTASGDEVEDMRIAPFVGQTFRDVETQLIKATLESCEHNKSQTAKMLGISLKTLYNRLVELDA